MIWNHLIQRVIFFLNGPGIVGNIFIFVIHVYTFVTGPDRKPTDLILIHLAFSNTIIICSTGIRDTATVFYFRNIISNVGCKTVTYLGRVARGLSICTTCLLSVVQAVTISPRNTLWRKLKPQNTWQVLPSLLFFWILNSLISSNLLQYITAVNNTNGSGIGMYIGYCYMLPSRQVVRWLFLCLMAFRDVIFQSLMGLSSGYMAFHLYKHHKSVFYLHSSRFANKSSPEIRATLSTLILMTCFLVFYWVDFIFSFRAGSILPLDSTLLNVKTFLELGYPFLSPLVLISRDAHVAKFAVLTEKCQNYILHSVLHKL